MSGIQAVLSASAFEPTIARIAPAEPARTFESGSTPAGQQAASNAKENKFRFDNLSEEDKKKLEKELKKVNDSLVSYGKQLRFKYNEEAKQMYVEVVDTESQKVVASLPPEFLIDLSIKMKEMIGVFLDKRL
jgi:flagellar protein FlaG